MPFGGRQDALDLLEQWRTQSDKPFLLLAAPAGRGKSALLSRWVDWLSQPGLSKTAAVVFVPVSSRFNTNLPELIFPCIAVQLALLLGEEVAANYINMPPGFWQSLVGEYLRRSLPDGRPILLIVDGLDEAAWNIDPSLFPLDLPPTTRIVVSARYLAGDPPGPGPWLGRLGWERFSLAETFSLEALTRDGVRDVLINMDQPLDALLGREDILDQLYFLTRGDPLLVKLYVDWLNEQGESSIHLRPEDLVKIEPDYRGLFDYWWQAQERLWVQTGQADPMEKPVVRTILSILATALGPLRISDIKQLIPVELSSNKYTILQGIKPLRRFVVGDGEKIGYSLAHSRLADYFHNEFIDDQERRERQASFVQWGKVTIDNLRMTTDSSKFEVSNYLLQYYSRHLYTSNSSVDTYLSLLSWEWSQSWYRFAGTYAGFLRDVDVILERLIAVDQQAIMLGTPAPHIAQEIQCVLCHASVNSLSMNIPIDLLVAQYRYGGWNDEQVLAYARQKPEAEERSIALGTLSSCLPAERRQEILHEAFQAAHAVREQWRRVRALHTLIPYLPEEERTNVLQQALQAAQAVWDEGNRGVALEYLASYLPEEVYQSAQAIQAEWPRIITLCHLIPYLPEEKQKGVLQEGIEAAWAMQDGRRRAAILFLLAPYLPEEVYGCVQTIQDEWNRTRNLCNLIPYLPTEKRADVTQQALQIARAIRDNNERARILYRLASHLPEDERSDVLRQALQAAQAMQDNEMPWANLRAWNLSKLAPYFPEEVYRIAQSTRNGASRALILCNLIPYLSEEERANVIQQAFQAAQSIQDEFARSQLLGSLASHLPEEVYQSVQTIQNERLLGRILCTLVPHIPEEQRANVLRRALQSARAEQDDWWRAVTLGDLIPYLPEEQQADILQQALQSAQAVWDETRRSGALSGLAPYLPEKVFQSAQAIQAEWPRAMVLCDLIPYLPEEERREVLQQVVQAAHAVQDENERARILYSLAPHLPKEEQAHVFHRALQAAKSVEDEGYRAGVLGNLASYLPEEVYEMSWTIQTEGDRGWLLYYLAPYLPDVVYQAAQSLQDVDARTRVMANLADFLITLPNDVLGPIWITNLKDLKRLSRSELLHRIADLVPLIAALGGDTSLSRTLRVVEDVSRWWP